MNEFWLAIFALTIIALAFVLVPIIRYQLQGTKVNASSDWFVNRQQELQQEFESGLFTEQEYQQAITELKLTAKDELVTAKAELGSQKQAFADKKLVILASVILIVGSVGFYSQLGQFDKLDERLQTLAKMPALSKKVVEQGNEQVTVEELTDFALGLRTKLAQKQDPIGWMLLGRVLLSLNDLDGAISAFEKSHDMNPDNASNNYSLAQALQLKGEQWDLQRSIKLLQQVMSVQPQNEMAIILFGEGNMMLENFELAKRSFEFAKQVLPQGDARHTALDSRINFLNQQLGLSVAPSIGAKLNVAVSLAPELNGKLSSFTNLFVFAQTPNMPMPIAVKKLSITEFPVTITLTDQDIMLPEQKLSDFENVNITARLSVDEQASFTKGEWQGQVVNISTSETSNINIEINKEKQ